MAAGALLAVLTACSDGGELRVTPLAGVAKRSPAPTFITLSQVHGIGRDAAVVGCPHGTVTAMRRNEAGPAGAADGSKVAGNQQIVVLAKGKSVTRVETISGSSVDLCGGRKDFPVAIAPATKIALSVDKWRDGSGYLIAKY